MSLFAEDTVIIVGAGASVPFGLPTGAEMIDLIVKEFRDEAGELTSKLDSMLVRRRIPLLAPIIYAMKFKGDISQDVNPLWVEEYLLKLAEWLEQQTGDSVDDIIRHNPSRADDLKVGICKILFDRIYDFDKSRNQYVPKPFENRNFDARLRPADENTKSRNWIHHLINLARSQLVNRRAVGFHPDLKLKVISFNYDGILEHVLDRKWKSTEAEFGDWRDYIEIVHPHGTIEIRDSVEGQDVAAFLSENAQKISVVHDDDEHCHTAVAHHRKCARDFCWRAADVYAIGFAFARANVELLELHQDLGDVSLQDATGDRITPDRVYHYTNYDDSFGLRARVEATCHKSSFGNRDGSHFLVIPKEMTAGPGRKLEISEALIAGFLGEMPA